MSQMLTHFLLYPLGETITKSTVVKNFKNTSSAFSVRKWNAFPKIIVEPRNVHDNELPLNEENDFTVEALDVKK